MDIICWNVAGIRSLIKKGALDFLIDSKFDVLCLQETKALESQVDIPLELKERFPYRYWGENHGLTQRKGLSGTAIWSRIKPLRHLSTPDFDTEGRITALEFRDFYLVTVYTPNSQGPRTERMTYRVNIWDQLFRDYIESLNSLKPTIVCGDFNVAHQNIDIYNPIKYKNSIAGFLDVERNNFTTHLYKFVDIYRELYPDKIQYTYWDQIRPHMRTNNKGWRIDYFLIPKNYTHMIYDSLIHDWISGSDHCPISLTLKKNSSLKIIDVLEQTSN